MEVVLDAFCARNTAGRNGRLDAAAGALKVLSVWEPAGEGESLALPSRQGSRVVIVRLTVSDQARNEEDHWWRLPATHFRLVSDKGRSHYPVAYLTAQTVIKPTRYDENDPPEPKEADWHCHPPKSDQGKLLLGNLVISRKWHTNVGPENLVIDWVYLIPREQTPQYVAFRRVAVSDILPKIVTEGAWPPTPSKADPVIKPTDAHFRTVEK